MTLRRLGIQIQQILVKLQPTRCPINAQGASLSPLLIYLSSIQVLQPYICIWVRDSSLPQATSQGVLHPSCLFGVRLSAYPAARNASSPRDGGKEASSCIALDRTIRVRPDRSALLFCSSVYGAQHSKVIPSSAHYIYKVSPIYLKARLLSLQKKTTSQQNYILISRYILQIVGRIVALSLFLKVYIKLNFKYMQQKYITYLSPLYPGSPRVIILNATRLNGRVAGNSCSRL